MAVGHAHAASHLPTADFVAPSSCITRQAPSRTALRCWRPCWPSGWPTCSARGPGTPPCPPAASRRPPTSGRILGPVSRLAAAPARGSPARCCWRAAALPAGPGAVPRGGLPCPPLRCRIHRRLQLSAAPPMAAAAAAPRNPNPGPSACPHRSAPPPARAARPRCAARGRGRAAQCACALNPVRPNQHPNRKFCPRALRARESTRAPLRPLLLSLPQAAGVQPAWRKHGSHTLSKNPCCGGCGGLVRGRNRGSGPRPGRRARPPARGARSGARVQKRRRAVRRPHCLAAALTARLQGPHTAARRPLSRSRARPAPGIGGMSPDQLLTELGSLVGEELKVRRLPVRCHARPRAAGRDPRGALPPPAPRSSPTSGWRASTTSRPTLRRSERRRRARARGPARRGARAAGTPRRAAPRTLHAARCARCTPRAARCARCTLHAARRALRGAGAASPARRGPAPSPCAPPARQGAVQVC
jgi:hypothetical protein